MTRVGICCAIVLGFVGPVHAQATDAVDTSTALTVSRLATYASALELEPSATTSNPFSVSGLWDESLGAVAFFDGSGNAQTARQRQLDYQWRQQMSRDRMLQNQMAIRWRLDAQRERIREQQTELRFRMDAMRDRIRDQAWELQLRAIDQRIEIQTMRRNLEHSLRQVVRDNTWLLERAMDARSLGSKVFRVLDKGTDLHDAWRQARIARKINYEMRTQNVPVRAYEPRVDPSELLRTKIDLGRSVQETIEKWRSAQRSLSDRNHTDRWHDTQLFTTGMEASVKRDLSIRSFSYFQTSGIREIKIRDSIVISPPR